MNFNVPNSLQVNLASFQQSGEDLHISKALIGVLLVTVEVRNNIKPISFRHPKFYIFSHETVIFFDSLIIYFVSYIT